MITPYNKVKSQDLKAGMTVRNSLGINVKLDHVEIFPARYVRAGWHMPACVLVFYNDRRDSHTFHFDEVLEHVEEKDLVLHQRTEDGAGAETDCSPASESKQG